MQNNDAAEPKPVERSDWSNAFEAVSRLVAARELALQEIGQDQPETSILEIAAAQPEVAGPSSKPPRLIPISSRAPSRRSRSVSVLRQADPALEVWSPNAAAPSVAEILVDLADDRRHLDLRDPGGAGAAGAILYLLS
jgi:hypothetical protein